MLFYVYFFNTINCNLMTNYVYYIEQKRIKGNKK